MSFSFLVDNEHRSEVIQNVFKSIDTCETTEETINCFGEYSIKVEDLFRGKWFTQELAPFEFFIEPPKHLIEKQDDSFFHCLDFGDTINFEPEFTEWVEALLKTLDCTIYTHTAPRHNFQLGLLQKFLKQLDSTFDKNKLIDSFLWSRFYKPESYVFSLHKPCSHESGINPALNADETLKLIDIFCSEFDYQYSNLNVGVMYDNASGNHQVDSRRELAEIIFRMGGVISWGELRPYFSPDSPLYRCLENSIISSFHHNKKRAFLTNLDIALEFDVSGIIINFSAKNKLNEVGFPYHFYDSPVYEVLSELFHSATGIKPSFTFSKKHFFDEIEWHNASVDQEISSMTKLLKSRKQNISTIKANKLLLDKGILKEVKKHHHEDDKPRFYKVLTSKGKKYGINKASPYSESETAPYYFEDKFDELLELYLKSKG